MPKKKVPTKASATSSAAENPIPEAQESNATENEIDPGILSLETRLAKLKADSTGQSVSN